MSQRFVHLLSYLPFVISVISTVESDNLPRLTIKMNWGRILELVVIAVITGMISSYVAVRELKFEMKYMQRDIQILKTEVLSNNNRLIEYLSKLEKK